MLIITTKESAVYAFEYRDLDGNGERLAALRRAGPDDHDGLSATGGPMAARRWYPVSVLEPARPRIAGPMVLVLDPLEPGAAPIVRRTSTVLSVVGML